MLEHIAPESLERSVDSIPLRAVQSNGSIEQHAQSSGFVQAYG